MHGHPSYASDDRRESASSVLREDVCDHLRRGVRIYQVLRSFGRSFSASTGSAEDFELSSLTDKLDDFISHDWQTGRWLKFVALCMVYNGHMAAVASCVVAIIVGIFRARLEARGLVPWCLLAAFATAHGVLLFGQRIRWFACRRSPRVFVDKICINQLNDKEKAEGICSIAGFMRSSEHLVLLWSARYFTRLWCVYEIATWLHIGKDLQRSMTFMPVSLAACMIAAQAAVFVATIFWYIVTETRLTVPVLLPVLLVAVLCPAAAYVIRRGVRDLLRLPSQLEAFRIAESECFCCTNDHIHPKTKQPLSCDREMVYATLGARYSHKQGCLTTRPGEHLHSFDAAVKNEFRDAVAAAFGTIRLSYRHALFTSTPAAWLGVELLVNPLNRSSTLLACRYALLYLCFFAFALPSIFQISLYFTMVSLKCCETVTTRTEAAVVLLTGLLVPAVFGIIWVPYGYAFTVESCLPQLGLSVAQAVLACICFSDVFKHGLRLMQGGKEALAVISGACTPQLSDNLGTPGTIIGGNDIEDNSGEMEVEVSAHGQAPYPAAGHRCRPSTSGAERPAATEFGDFTICVGPTVTL